MAQQARRAENAQSENLEETNKKPIFTEKETSYERRNGLPQAEIEVSLSEQEASVFMEVMGANAVEQPIIELNSSNWIQQFGADGKVSTPLGEVKMGNNQIAKLFEKGRNEQFGMIKPTLETPLAVIEVPSEATEQETERASSLLFVKTFLGKNGERVYYFKSVTVKKDGMEVSVSSHYDRPKRIKEALKNGKLLYRFDGGAQTEHRPADTSVAASRNEEQGLSDSKDSDIPSKKQNPGGNGLSPDDAGNGRTADTGGRGTEQGTERVIPTADTAQTAATGQTPETPAESSNLSIHESQQKQTGIPYRLSNELDENGCPFVLASDGTTIFGEIRADSGLQPAPIKLSRGIQDENGKGYGLLHIEANHGEEIRKAGFSSVNDFVSFIAHNYDKDNIRVGKRRHNGNITYLLQVTDSHDNTLFIEMSRDGSYWNVNSAGVFRKKYSNKKETVVKTEPQQPNNAISAGSSLSENEESGITSSEPNGEPPVSNSKYSKESPNVQEPSGHRTGEEAGSRDIIDMTEEELAEIRAKEREKIDRIFGKEYLDNVAEAVEKRKAERKAVVSKAAKELRSELSTSPDIVLVSDLKDIPEEDLQGKTPQEAIRRMRAKGWYTPGNGKVYINLSMHSTAEDVKATILHEAVAHKGLRALLGEESFGALCDAVYRSMPKKRQKAYEDTYKKIYPNTAEAELRRIIADEYMARLAEGGVRQSIPQRIISAIREFLRSIGIDLDINDADIRHLLAQSYKNMQEADAVKVLDNSALLARLRKAAEETHIKSEAESLYRLGKKSRDAYENGVLKESLPLDDSAGEVRFRIREDAPPQKTGIGYKVFVLKNGKLYPPMVANPNGADTPIGVWLDADAAPITGQSKTGRNQVKAGGKGTQGGSGKLAFRPGWHLGEIPYALQFNRIDETGVKSLFPRNFVWAEVEYANDVDYQDEARSYGINVNGKYQHSLAGLPRIPVNGSYKYRTNPNPETDPWIITGAIKVNRLLTPSEVDEMVRNAGREPQQRQSGSITDDEVMRINKENMLSLDDDADIRFRMDNDLEAVNRRFNEELERYQQGKMSKNEMFHLGLPNGVMSIFLPNLPIVMRQRVVNKGANKKHNVEVSSIINMPQKISEPIFVFKKDDKSLSILSEMKDKIGRNVFVAFDLSSEIQDGGRYIEVNDVTTVHGRRIENIIRPINENNSLQWVDKKKALEWFSSASPNVQQEITSQELKTASNIIKNFENPNPETEKNTEDIRFRMDNEAHQKSFAVTLQLIENAIFIDELPNEKGNGKYDSYRYYVCGLKIGGVDYTVKVTIGVKQGKRYYDHSLTEIEKGNLYEIANGFTSTGGAPVPSSAEYKDRRLLSLLQTNSSKVVDENGEPRVVYHGTNESFLSFDRNKAGISRNTCERQGRIGRNIWQKFFPERIRDSQKADGRKNGRINNLENKKSYSHRRKSYKNDAYFGFEQNFQHQR